MSGVHNSSAGLPEWEWQMLWVNQSQRSFCSASELACSLVWETVHEFILFSFLTACFYAMMLTINIEKSISEIFTAFLCQSWQQHCCRCNCTWAAVCLRLAWPKPNTLQTEKVLWFPQKQKQSKAFTTSSTQARERCGAQLTYPALCKETKTQSKASVNSRT